MLALSYGVDALLAEHQIDPATVIAWLVEEGHVDLNDYFDDGDDNVQDQI